MLTGRRHSNARILSDDRDRNSDNGRRDIISYTGNTPHAILTHIRCQPERRSLQSPTWRFAVRDLWVSLLVAILVTVFSIWRVRGLWKWDVW